MKKQNKWLWLLLIVMLGLNACQKEDETIGSGEVKLQVTEYGSNSPVKNAFVGLLKRTSNGVGSSASWEVLQSAETDSNGFVYFGNYTNWSNLYIDVQHPDYYDISTISYDVVKSQQSRISVNGIAYLGIKFIPDKMKQLYRTVRSYTYKINFTDSQYKFYPTIANKLSEFSFAVFSDWDNSGDPKYLLYDSIIYLQSPKLLDTAYYTIKF